MIYLASKSPRRSQLLDQLGAEHKLLEVDAPETPLLGEAPSDYVQRVTLLKLQAALSALSALSEFPELLKLPVLCADTTVTLNGEIFGKPANAQDAVRILRRLSGQEHEVLTAVAVATASTSTTPLTALSISKVRFCVMSEEEITAYVASGEPMGKAGAYAVQGRAAAYISHISGSYSGIMGLPLFETAQLLTKAINQSY